MVGTGSNSHTLWLCAMPMPSTSSGGSTCNKAISKIKQKLLAANKMFQRLENALNTTFFPWTMATYEEQSLRESFTYLFYSCW
jgi:hypothetical protein